MFIRADISALPATKFQYTFYGNIGTVVKRIKLYNELIANAI